MGCCRKSGSCQETRRTLADGTYSVLSPEASNRGSTAQEQTEIQSSLRRLASSPNGSTGDNGNGCKPQRTSMVTENDIKTRAYFHFENRTGKNWDDSASNWSQAEAEERALATARALDISGELFTFRPLSQMIPLLVVFRRSTKRCKWGHQRHNFTRRDQAYADSRPPSGAPVSSSMTKFRLTLWGFQLAPT